jgi:streptogramin lyase
LDASGNVWTANYFNSVTELSNIGEPLSPASGFTGGGLDESYGIAVASNGTVWVTNEESSSANKGHGSLTVLNSSGQVISGTDGYFGGGVFFPVAIASDSDGKVWTANYGSSTASLLSENGSPISGGGGFGADQLSGPVAVAMDANHNAWFANQSGDSGYVTSISPDGSHVTRTTGCGEEPSGIATDAIGVAAKSSRGHVWTGNYESSTVSELALSNNGSVIVASAGYSGAGLNHPHGIAVDGAGNVWVTNFEGNTLSELQGANGADPGQALSPGAGLGQDAHLGRPYGIAIDASGDLWVSNFGRSTITVFVGAASPVKTPLAGPAQLP